MGTYGNVVFIKHNINGIPFETVYAHLSSSTISIGDEVKKGQTIGYISTWSLLSEKVLSIKGNTVYHVFEIGFEQILNIIFIIGIGILIGRGPFF